LDETILRLSIRCARTAVKRSNQWGVAQSQEQAKIENTR